MVGHAVWVPEMMIRSRPSSITIDELILKSKTNNYKMISQAVSTGDAKLDEKAWQKTKDECDRNIAFLIKSYSELVEQLGENVVIAVRRAIWERHGNARDWSVRVIDGFLAGMQNHASSYCCAHRPATMTMWSHRSLLCEGWFRRPWYNHGLLISTRRTGKFIKFVIN